METETTDSASASTKRDTKKSDVDNAPKQATSKKKLNDKLKKLSLASRSSCVPVQVTTFSHVWSIHNFSHCCENVKDDLTSSYFSSGPNDEDDEVLWCLILHLPSSEEDNENHLSINLRLHSSPTVVSAKFKVSILSSSYEDINANESYVCKFGYDNFDSGFCKFIKKDDLLAKANELLPDDTLTIFCQVDVLNVTNKQATAIEFKIPSSRLSEDLGSLYASKQFSDVFISVAGKEFSAHKGILAARSPVFQAMFQHEMKESKSNRVEINDVYHKVFTSMLRFIYTEEALGVEELAEDLLVAADKYALETLKCVCEKELCSKLSTENVVRMLILADLHSCNQLKCKAISFIKLHVAKVMATKGWSSILQYSELIVEVLRAVALAL